MFPCRMPPLLIPMFALLLSCPLVAHAQNDGRTQSSSLRNLRTLANAQNGLGLMAVEDADEWLAKSKRLAREAFAATQADPKALARVQCGVAREAFQVCSNTFFLGVHHYSYLRHEASEWLKRIGKAEQAAGGTPADLRAALEHRWLWAARAERFTKALWHAGVESVDEPTVHGVRIDRLDAELAWKRAPAAKGKQPAGALPLLLHGKNGSEDLRIAARVARIKAKDQQQTEKALHLARGRAARAQLSSFFEGWRSGQRGFHLGRILALVEPYVEAEAAVRGDAVDPRALAEMRWVFAKCVYDMNLGRYLSRVEGYASERVAAAAYTLHDAELRWLQARAAAGKKRTQVALIFPGYLEIFVDTDLDVNGELWLAKAKFEALQRTPAEVLRDKLEAARTVIDACGRLYAAGHPTAKVQLSLHPWWPRLVEAESAVAALEGRKDRLHALEASWRFWRSIEQSEKERYDAGKVSARRETYLLAVYERLEAQRAWLRALTEAKGK